MITSLLRREGWLVNRKRVHRLWKQAGLQVPKKQRKRRRLGTSDNGCLRLKAQYPGHVWSVDFLFDTTEDGRQIKFMPVLDEYTRQCLGIDVSRSITSARVIRELTRLFREHGPPANLRSDNGPEFIAEALKRFLADQEVQTRYIEPGAPCPLAERLCRVVQRDVSRRDAGSRALLEALRSRGAQRAVSASLQRASSSQQSRLPDARRIRSGHAKAGCGDMDNAFGVAHIPTVRRQQRDQRRPSRTGAGTNIAPGTKNGGTS